MPLQEIFAQRLKYGYDGGGVNPGFVSLLSTNAGSEHADSELVGKKCEYHVLYYYQSHRQERGISWSGERLADLRLGIKKKEKEGKEWDLPTVLFAPLSTAGYKLKQGYTAGSTNNKL